MRFVRKIEVMPEIEVGITKDRFVGFIDIMGFKDMVARLKHQDVYKKLKIISEFKTQKAAEPMYSEKPIVFLIFSDSVIMFSTDNTQDAMKELLRNMRLLVERLLLNAIPFKGAIAFGQTTLDTKNSIFFGQPLIDAYLLAEDLLAYAVIAHHTAEKELRSDKTRILETEVATKNGLAVHRVISPTINFFEKNAIAEITDKFRLMTSGSLRRYIDNTQRLLQAAEVYQKNLRK